MAKGKKKKTDSMKHEPGAIRKFTLRDSTGILHEAETAIGCMEVVKKPSLNTYILEAVQEYNKKHCI